MLRVAISISCLFWLLSLVPAHAIVNIESENIAEIEEGFKGKLSLLASGQSGNTDNSRLLFGSRFQWHHGKIINFIAISVDYGETNNIRDTDKKFFHVRHIRELSKRRSWELFGQVEENEFTRLSFRGLAGTGLRLRLNRESKNKALFLGLGVFRSREELAEAAGTTDAGIERLWRANIYFSVKYKINKNSTLVSTTYYQPAFRDDSDYRFLEQFSLVVKLTKRLDLKLSVDIAHDNRPPQLIEKTDTTYATGIEYSF